MLIIDLNRKPYNEAEDYLVDYFSRKIVLQEKNREICKIVGSPGLGKANLCNQVAKRISEKLELENPFQMKLFKCDMLSQPDDFLLPMLACTGEVIVLRSIDIPDTGIGFFVLDNPQRTDPSMRKFLNTMIEDHKIGSIDLPEKWDIIILEDN